MKTIGKNRVYDGKHIQVDILDMQLANGKIIPWEAVSRKNNMPVVAALVENITNGTFVLVEQYRAAVGAKVVELVAGVCDKKNYSKEDIIRAEILEETGYTAQLIELLIENTPKSPGIISELGTTYYAQVIGERGEQRFEDTESIEVLEFEKKDINTFLDSKRKQGILISTGIYSVIGNMLSKGVNILE